MERTFSTPAPVRLTVELQAGDVRIDAADVTETTVDLRGRNEAGEQLVEEARVEQRGDEILVIVPKPKGGLFRNGKAEVEIRVSIPDNSAVRVETGSADVTTRGRLGDTDIKTGSGDIEVDVAAASVLKTGSGDVKVNEILADLEIKTGSGDIVAGTIHGQAAVSSGSGDIVVRTPMHGLKVRTGSGDIVVSDAGDDLNATTGSGDLVVKRVSGGNLRFKAGSGDVAVGVVDGTAVFLDVMTGSGKVVCDLDASERPDDGPSAELHVMTGSGDIRLTKV